MNRLAHESSPYLLQHRNNLVNWYPWSDEALGRARAEDKPIFLSIGYSACHWCHVMEHESFESPAIAALLNEHFVCIKVDREERPDLDHIYMQAVQMITGRGGWPLSAFLTPELQPFYGGTYWPPTTRMGMPGFDDILKGVIGAWSERRDQALEQAAQLTAAIGEGNPFIITTAGSISEELIQKARQRWANTFDSTHGGFGGAPKFPRSVELQMLLHSWYRDRDSQTLEMVCLTLDKMAAGGMYDQLGGGFARYSVDAQWLVPHFEKMLYDNALLVDAYLDAYQVTGRERYAEIVQETLDYVLRDMVDSENGFHSTEDADSEGVEGKYYVWSLPEIESILGPDLAKPFCQTYGVTRQGNFEGQNILHLSKPLASLGDTSLSEAEKDQAITLSGQLRDARAKLLAHREQRVRPGKDDKVLVSWNGLMIHALARAACLLKRDEYLEAAQRAAKFILTEMRREDGRLLHCYRGGIAKLDAYLDDYACLANSLITLYESDFDEQWLEQAEQLCEIVMEHFQDAAEGGFFFTADDHEQLVARTKEWVDASVPGSNAMMATALLRLGKLTGRPDLLAAGQRTVETAAGMLEKAPEASGQMLIAADLLLGPTWELVVVTTPDTPETDEVISRLYNTFLPRKVLACRQRTVSSQKSQRLTPLFTGKVPVPGTTQLYVCHDHTCQQPVVGAADISAKINELATG